MPTVTLLRCFESENSIFQSLGPLPPDRVWVPADNLPAALNVLALLQRELTPYPHTQHMDDFI